MPKVIILATIDAVVSISYTGVAVVHQEWFDTVLADTLAHRELDSAMIQPGTRYLSRPLYTVIQELSWNLNGRLNRDKRSRLEDLQLSIIGFHVHRHKNICKPLSWSMSRDLYEDGNRYFKIKMSKLGRFVRQFPRGLSLDYYGDHGDDLPDQLRALGETENLDHDAVERYIVNLIKTRSTQSPRVGADSIAVQIDLRIPESHVQVTYYPQTGPVNLLSPWVLLPRMICSPTLQTPTSEISACGKYAVGGFSEGVTNLHIATRIPIEFCPITKKGLLYDTVKRKKTT